MQTRLPPAVLIIALALLLACIGCGGGDLVVDGTLPPPTVTPAVTPGCLPSGADCGLSGTCCSAQCVSLDGVTLECL